MPGITADIVGTSQQSFGIRNTGTGSFAFQQVHNGTLTAARALTWNLNNAARSISLSGNLSLAGSLTTSGSFASTFTMTGATAVTFPTSGTLSTLAGVETLQGKTLALPRVSTSATVTAGTNAQGQGALTSDYNVVTTASNNPSGVTLPIAASGNIVTIVNRGANPLKVYPASGGSIDGGATNAAIDLPVGALLTFRAENSTVTWTSTAKTSVVAAGSFTPTLTFVTPGNLSVSYILQTGVYRRINDLVYVQIQLVTSSFSHTTASGDLLITGSPFTTTTTNGSIGVAEIGGITKAGGYTNFNGRFVSGGFIRIQATGSGVSSAAVQASDMPTGGTVSILLTISYPV